VIVTKRWIVGAAAVIALLAAACGSDDGSNNGAAAGGDGENQLSISSPSDGAEVTVPFNLEFSSAVPLGAPDTGEHHVHVYFDGNDADYEVVSTDSFQVTDLSDGDHTITASLRNADHSAAGSDVTIAVTVTGGGGDSGSGGSGNRYGNNSGGSGDDSGDDSGDGNYGY
jgi:hypothetical protein